MSFSELYKQVTLLSVFCVSVSVSLYVFFLCNSIFKMRKKTRSSKPESPVQDKQGQAAILVAEDEDEFVTMAQVLELLKVQESMLKALFESVLQSLSMRLDEVVKSVQSIKTSLEFTQKNMEELKPVQAELIKTSKEIERLNSDLSSQSLSLEYMENRCRRNNIRVNGILESSRETWEEAEEKVKDAVKTKLGVDIDIERAHRVERKHRQGKESNQPRAIVCKLRDWKQREQVLRKARKEKPSGIHISEDLALATLKKLAGALDTEVESCQRGWKGRLFCFGSLGHSR